MTPDAELLRRYATEGSNAAFADIVARHLGSVYGAALRQLDGNGHLAEEVAQAVFTQLARKAATLSPATVLAGWLYNATHYTVANVRRSEFRRRVREQEAFLMREEHDDFGWERLRPVLDDVLWELKAADRDAVLLRFFEDQPYREIAVTLHVSEDAARMRTERALASSGTCLSGAALDRPS